MRITSCVMVVSMLLTQPCIAAASEWTEESAYIGDAMEMNTDASERVVAFYDEEHTVLAWDASGLEPVESVMYDEAHTVVKIGPDTAGQFAVLYDEEHLVSNEMHTVVLPAGNIAGGSHMTSADVVELTVQTDDAGESELFAAAISDEELNGTRGAAKTVILNSQSGITSGNTFNGDVSTGNNSIDQSFGGNGVSMVVQNSGNGVTVNAITNFNIELGNTPVNTQQ